MKLALGLGCDRGTPLATLQACIAEALHKAGGTLAEVRAVASIDLKADERAFLELAQQYGWQIHFYAAFELAAVPVPNPSETVRRHTGTPSVSEAAAVLVAHTDATQLIVEKHRLRGSDGRSATVSIARIPE
jgi:cobalt-precorrin 5A hydrolase